VANGLYETVRGRRHPIFLEFPIDVHPRTPTDPRFPRIKELLARNESVYCDHLKGLLEFSTAFAAIPRTASPSAATPRWNNGSFPALDGMALHAFLTRLNPKRYLEIGVGNSTRFARHAIKLHGLKTRVITIDLPSRATGHELSDEVIRSELQSVPVSVFRELEAGDVLFYDGSHLLFQNSDVTVFFLDILPELAPGVWVQIHDICLPGDYGPDFAERYWNEQYLLAAWLLGGGSGIDVQLPVHYVWRDAPHLATILGPLFELPVLKGLPAVGASFWLRTREYETNCAGDTLPVANAVP
jgi:hypothetical protein